MNKRILAISLGLNLILLGSSFTSDARSRIISNLEDLREWMEQDFEAALDHGDTGTAEHLAQYMETIEETLEHAYDKPIEQPEFNHFVYTKDAKVVTDSAGNVNCVWVDGQPYTLDLTILENL